MTATEVHYDWRHAAAVMFDAHQPVEVTAIDPATHEPVGPTSHTQLLDVPADSLMVELPNEQDTVKSIRHTHHASLLLIDVGVRLECLVRVEEVLKHQLNAQTQVWAMRMSPPLDIHSAQRRAFFRAMTAHLKLTVTVQPLADTPLRSGIEIADGTAIKAVLSNISGGGIGVIAPQRAGAILEQYGRFRCRVALPTHEEPLVATMKHVHLHANPDGTHYMGLAFQFADAADQSHVEDRICRFTTWLQRQELARQH